MQGKVEIIEGKIEIIAQSLLEAPHQSLGMSLIFVLLLRLLLLLLLSII